MRNRGNRSSVDWRHFASAGFGLVTGLCIAIVVLSVVKPQSAATGASMATAIAVLVALCVGLVPWLVARDDRKTRSAVIASRIAHHLEIAQREAAVIRDGLGHAAETRDAKRIKESAKRCMPVAPETLDENFDRISAFPYQDALTVCDGVMAAIDQYVGTFKIANVDLEEAFQGIRMQVVSDNFGIVPEDLDGTATRLLDTEMMQYGRRAAARAMDTQTRIASALDALRRHGAITPKIWGELFESPVPEVAAAVRDGKWPPEAVVAR